MLFKMHFFAVFWGAYSYQLIPRIEECGLTCSQGFHCKTQTSTGVSNNFCHPPPSSFSATTLRNMKLWTAMKCVEQSQCSLYLSVKGTLHLNENVHGMEICSFSMDTQKSQCVNVKISKNVHGRLAGKKVKVQFNCFEVSAGQHLHVSMKTIPNYCGVQRNQEYYVEDCRNSDVGKNIPVCFASKMAYDVDRARKTIFVNISDVVQGTDYYVRLCHRWFVCEDVEPVILIQGNDLMKSVSLQYTQLLPCLCIETWPAISDARRMQLCPFKNDTEALWDSISYNPVTQTLAWEAACPVQVTVSLCELMKTNDPCVDLENTSNAAPEKVKYSRVDAHPSLCMKFTTNHGSWVRCPFAHGNFQAWKMRLAVTDEQIEVSFTSRAAEAEFSVLVCNRTESSLCNSVGTHQPVSVGGLSSTSVNISGKTCGSNICIQGWRTDVDYSIPSYVCDLPCASSVQSQERDENSLSILSLGALLALLVAMMALLGHKLLSVFHKKSHEEKSTAHTKTQTRASILCIDEEKQIL
ncbi:putative interleukin-17 receptor E-like [Rhineura floridana]|uniref:putative interleukin-17 receptor E-like n=1 Tax=Rhineura floridana TaxID=261503 RepID=UPI002AC87814|nr:putative interleukin-17 receptor E-like [Rhineura floridana]